MATTDFVLTPDVYVTKAYESLEAGDYPNCISLLRSAYETSGNFDIGVKLYDVYCDIGLIREAEQVLVDMYTRVDSVDVLIELYRLSESRNDNFASSHYFAQIAKHAFLSDTGIDFSEVFDEYREEKVNHSYRSYKPYERRLEQALGMIAYDPDGAYDILATIPKSACCYIEARVNMAFIKYERGDNNSAYGECEHVLLYDRDNAQALSMMISISAMEKDNDNVAMLVDRIKGLKIQDYGSVSNVAVSLCEAGMHEDAVRYFEKLKVRYDKNINVLMSIALYNSGRKDEAIHKLKDLHKLYGRHCPARFFIRLMKKSLGTIPYLVHETYEEMLHRKRRVDELLSTSRNIKMIDGEIADLIYWVYRNVNDELVLREVSSCLVKFGHTSLMVDILKDIMIPDISKNVLVEELVFKGLGSTINVYIEGRVVRTKPVYPSGYSELSSTLRRAYAVAYSEALCVGTDFEDSLLASFKKFIYLYTKHSCDFRSVATVSALLLVNCRAIGEYKTFDDLKSVLNINRKTYDSYVRRLRGNGDEV